LKFTFEPDDLDILHGIVEESTEHLNGIEEGILRLEMDFAQDLIDRVFRAMHSVKGVASFLDFVPIKDTAHVLESFLTDIKKGLYSPSSEIIDILLRGVDILNMQVRQLQAHLQDVEANPPKEAFELEIDEFGFRDFVCEAEELRENAEQGTEINSKKEPNEETATNSQMVEAVNKSGTLKMSQLQDQMASDFIEEVVEHLDTIESKCMEFEKHKGDPEILNAILRGFHSIKGGAGVISSMQDADKPRDAVLAIKDLTHGIETLLQIFRNQSQALPSEAIDLILEVVDKVAVLTSAFTDPSQEISPTENLLKRIESLSNINQETKPAHAGESEEDDKMPRQLAAFINISSQALDSISGLLASIQIGQLVNPKRIKQYIRALKSLKSTAGYLAYGEVEQCVDKSIASLTAVVPGQDMLTDDLVAGLESYYLKIKELLENRINDIRGRLADVPAEYSEKRLGEILVAERKLTPEQQEWALSQQKKLGEILVESGMVERGDIEIAMAQQQIAKSSETAKVEQVRGTSEVSGQSIRVSQEKLDRLMNMIGELIISKNRIYHLSSKISMEYQMPTLSREVKGVAGELARISDELQDSIMSIRMIPLRMLFQRYPRTIRDSSKKAGKIVEFIVEGEDTELDKNVIEAINDPLVHMLRNAVDHAIEAPEVRESNGKTPTGTVSLKAYYQGNYVVIEIADDGKGLNPDELKLKALKKGLIRAEQVENMSNEEAYHLIFAPGFSTKEVVSELSGRGVGMDVVRNNIESVGGLISMSSAINVGTTFTLKIPLSLSIIRGLMVDAARQIFIIPLEAIEETVKLSRKKIRSYQNSMMADIRGEIMSLVDLRNILGLGRSDVINDGSGSADDSIAVVVIKTEGLKYGLIIDRFQKEQEFVVKALSEELASLKVYTGATILGDGSVVLIINPSQLLQEYNSAGIWEAAEWQ